MGNAMLTGAAYNTLIGTITGGGTLTAEIDLAEYTLVGLIVPTMSNGTLSFYTSAYKDGSGSENYVQLKDKTLTNYTIGATTGQFAIGPGDLTFLAGLRYVKIGITPAQNIQFRLPVRA